MMRLMTIMRILCLMLPLQCFAITEYRPGDKLFVWAESGLNMRATPEFNSKILTKIPYAEVVTCKEWKYWESYFNDSQSITDKVQLPEGKYSQVQLKGDWALVKFGDYEGYVFDAYLSRFRPLPKKTGGFKDLYEYFIEESDWARYIEKRDSTSEYGRDKIVLGNGVFMTINYHPAGLAFQIHIPDCSIEEAFLIIRNLDKYAIKIIQDKEGGIFIDQEMGGYRIESFKNSVIISGAWSC